MTTTAIAPGAPETAEPVEKKSKKKLIIIIVAVLALVGGGYYQFFMPKAEKAPEPGEVMALDSIQINLADEHYLRIGIALQMTTNVAHEPDGSAALDATISLFSGQELEEVNKPKHRDELKKHLEEELMHIYHGDVMGVYFREFVTQ